MTGRTINSIEIQDKVIFLVGWHQPTCLVCHGPEVSMKPVYKFTQLNKIQNLQNVISTSNHFCFVSHSSTLIRPQ